jgi:hypothetical protein
MAQQRRTPFHRENEGANGAIQAEARIARINVTKEDTATKKSTLPSLTMEMTNSKKY